MVATGESVSIIPVVPEELDAFEERVQEFRRGENEDTFLSFRVLEPVAVFGWWTLSPTLLNVGGPEWYQCDAGR